MRTIELSGMGYYVVFEIMLGMALVPLPWAQPAIDPCQASPVARVWEGKLQPDQEAGVLAVLK